MRELPPDPSGSCNIWEFAGVGSAIRVSPLIVGEAPSTLPPSLTVVTAALVGFVVSAGFELELVTLGAKKEVKVLCPEVIFAVYN